MGFNDLFNKGLNILGKGASSLKDAAISKKDALQEFSILKTRSNHLSDLKPFEVHNSNPSIGKEQLILSSCLTINVAKAKIINSLIPLEETVVNIKTARESITEMHYIFIITDQKLWIANEKEYKIYNFDAVTKCEIVNKGIMSQSVNFNDNAFVLDGTENDINKFCKTLTEVDYRNQEIITATNYLCGIKPVKQLLNLYLTGITLGENGKVVLHNGKQINRLVDLKDIHYVQLLMDNTVVLTKGKETQSMVSAQLDCRKMSIKVVLTNDNFLIDVMPQSMMNTLIKKRRHYTRIV